MTEGSEGEPIPARELPLAARAPAKVILFGEHAVVHGEPELLLAVDLYTQLGARSSESFALGGDRDPLASNPYFRVAVDAMWSAAEPLSLTVASRIPRAAGLGSSAAFVASLAAIMASARGGMDRGALAQEAFAIERGAQGVGSPGDTTASVAGGYLSLNSDSGRVLWAVTDGSRHWEVRRVEDPGWSWVVGYSGVPRDTGVTVKAVGRRLAEPDGPRLLERFREVAEEGISGLSAESRERVGRSLTRNHELLREVGVSHPRLEQLLDAVGPAVEGAKLTGAGAGGSIVALPRPGRELEVVRRIARAGGVPFAVRPVPSGVELIEPAVEPAR